MKLVRWKRFTWDIQKLPTPVPKLDERYVVRPAFPEDQKTVTAVLLSAFGHDSAWNDLGKPLKEWLAAQIETAFDREPAPAIVITHGQRIIAASAISTDVGAETHLLTGPCVAMEYRNRGMGTALLYHTLAQLRQGGLTVAHGISKENAPATKFVYPKFGAMVVEYDFHPAAARA